jgi:hypothetical protein
LLSQLQQPKEHLPAKQLLCFNVRAFFDAFLCIFFFFFFNFLNWNHRENYRIGGEGAKRRRA